MEGNIIHSSETRKPLQVNFGTWVDLMKIMDEADASHVEAIHYVASAGIRIGKEKLGMIKPGTGFGPPSSNTKIKGRLIRMMQS